ncbi:cardiolipin synthase [Lactobacillus jensenii]|uniref:cardiolipin synthase n=1 Tax=Lactobacillus jensenii TaxID=109790 RepID=UPI0001B95FC4|nr:cardiolipin synthase [Lactobacillus jensenii]EEX27058.1 phospholipase D domain protein [Lactobacillus jensenii SJ-7A-US]MCF1828052.1 cardiolipin synthase [Lactobacillus jensenii]MCF1850920.1 cardiolipin synthase [Lactobacillus jensenii]MCW8070988.1 cardiolipin synthase [Lactobacillus jensenii]MCZ3724534.1 cardiolipin synthase [Lactobacillus jensenii]
MFLLKYIHIIIISINTILAFYVVFRRKRSVATAWAWLIILLIFPILGFILYGFFGRGLSQENLFAINKQNHIGLRNVQKMIPRFQKRAGKSDTAHKAQVAIEYFNQNREAPLSKNNQVKLYTDGHEKFQDLMLDIEKARETINVEYYSFYNDNIGNQILNLLVKKAKEGIKVRLIYDAWGSFGATSKWFDKLRKAGGEVLPFITSRNMILRYRINYHLHRKIVVIDGRIAWTGGFNVGDQYLGKKKKFGYWRDTHVRIVGSAALLVQERFVMDWNASITKISQVITFSEKLFPDLNEDEITEHNVATQIVADGPDSEIPYMRNGMMRLMLLARKRLWIQTPYLIPDDAMIATWQIIVNSGVDLRIMIPSKPDHPFIYRATQWYANQLTKMGIKIYIYDNGFLHAKTIVGDFDYAVVGSMNQDYRSYSLNFEDMAVFYDSNINHELAQIFEEDMKNAHLLTIEEIQNQSHYLRSLQSFSRLLSPIL